ncbi:MAG: hypothetical protein COB90_10465 [Hyphomicrobiales bacterium]|nr:MAG: hypothetical protein COB90_10465 [Hyphomicrobiales bacterium]
MILVLTLSWVLVLQQHRNTAVPIFHKPNDRQQPKELHPPHLMFATTGSWRWQTTNAREDGMVVNAVNCERVSPFKSSKY